jgi:outer membrane protein assembly factor BamB
MLAPPPDITIDDVSLVEGNSGTTNARFTISLSFASSQLVEVDWVAKDGTATLADSDYQAASGRASFPPGTTSVFVDVPVVGDVKLEPNETFTVDLSNPLRGGVADVQGQGTILDDDGVPRMSIDDVRVVEGNTGASTAKFTVTLSNPSGATVRADWSTSDGGATGGPDYVAAAGTVSFPPGTLSQAVDVMVNGDVVVEPDETFHVDLKSPVGATLLKARGVGTILDDDSSARPPVRSFTVVSDGAATPMSGRDRLQWVNPVGGNPVEIRIRFTARLGCTPPTNADTTYDGLIQVFPPAIGAPGEPRSVDNKDLALGTPYCYTIWVIHSGGAASAGVSATGRPFDATGRLRWKYSTATGITGVAPPTVGLQGVLAVNNAGEVQAMTRSETGGPWPAGPPVWNPLLLGSPSQSRNPIVPLSGISRFFVTTQDGRVHAIDTATGALDWSRLVAPAAINGAPAGIFSAFGGQHDAVFAGTSATDDNVMHALDPATGAPLAAFGPPLNPGIGAIPGMAAVDYSTSPQRLYFATRRGSRAETLWCVNLGPPGPLAFTLRWRIAVGDISGSPVLRNGRVYVGTDAGEVLSVRADDGMDVRTLPLGDGAVRGFVFPDRSNDELFASTATTVWRLADGPPLAVKWGTLVNNPSPPLLWPGTTHVYVGGGDGSLHEIDTQTAAHKTLALDYDSAVFIVGAPSLDIGFALIHVGSEHGSFYAVRVPLP